jgi:serine kinase of HPr protein (carbohydrate metabolism regulator)
MKVRDIVEKLDLKVLCGEDFIDKDTIGAYTCDLLSWVMSHGNRGNAWVTVQVHPNVVAIALLLEFSCIIIPESIDVEKVSLEKAEEEGIPILQSTENAYVICGKLTEMGL